MKGAISFDPDGVIERYDSVCIHTSLYMFSYLYLYKHKIICCCYLFKHICINMMIVIVVFLLHVCLSVCMYVCCRSELASELLLAFMQWNVIGKQVCRSSRYGSRYSVS